MISKANSHKATHGEDGFRYKVSAKPVSDGIYELNITAQSEAYNGSKLRVIGIVQHDCKVIRVEEPKYRPEVIRPDIEGFIAEAVEQGWNFRDPGSNFILKVTNDIFTNPYDRNRPEGFDHGRNYQAKAKG